MKKHPNWFNALITDAHSNEIILLGESADEYEQFCAATRRASRDIGRPL